MEKLPRTIAISFEQMNYCIQCCRDELIVEADHAAFDRRIDEGTALYWGKVSEYRAMRSLVRRALNRPWIGRARWVAAHFAEPIRFLVYAGLWLAQSRLNEAKSYRVRPVWSATVWDLVADSDAPKPGNAACDEWLVEELAWTGAWAEWCEKGGHPDLGRYLGKLVELKRRHGEETKGGTLPSADA